MCNEFTKDAPIADLTLRLARPDDAAMLRRWDRKPHVIAAGGAWEQYDDFDWDEELARNVDWREFLIAETGDRPIGVLQIIDAAEEETHYWGDVEPGSRAIDIWIGEEDCLGQGFGTKMMNAAIARCFAPPEVTAILIDPLAKNKRAHRFYERLGFGFVERRFFDEDDCFVYKLRREDWRP